MNQKILFKGKEKGITLIALVITIIVLLILAGVAISMLSGENGILNQAAEAKTETEKKTAEEAVKLAAIDALMRGNDYTTIESETELEEALASQGLSISADKVNGNATEGYTVETEKVTYEVSADGTVLEKSIVTDATAVKMLTEVKATNYGDIVTGYSMNGVGDWKVFLNDGNNVWIIATNSFSINDTELMNAEALRDTDNWTAYVDTSLAIKAMGGPTLPMFAESYNAKYSVETIGYGGDELEAGYYYIPGGPSLDGLSTDEFYFFTLKSYYLASYLDAKGCTLSVESGGTLYSRTNGELCDVRPVVCLNADIEASYDNGVWTIKK